MSRGTSLLRMGAMDFPIALFRSRIESLCREYRVQRLDLFGSAATGDFAAHSDLDFLVEFLDQRPEGAADRYFGLRDGLQSVLQRPVDLVMRKAIRNPYFLREAQRKQLNIYVG